MLTLMRSVNKRLVWPDSWWVKRNVKILSHNLRQTKAQPNMPNTTGHTGSRRINWKSTDNWSESNWFLSRGRRQAGGRTGRIWKIMRRKIRRKAKNKSQMCINVRLKSRTNQKVSWKISRQQTGNATSSRMHTKLFM